MAPGFDRVLLDAPCSDLGALASRPDARWRKSPTTIERLAEVQSGAAARRREALRPGGTLVYSTCTISRRENEDRVAALLDGRVARSGAGVDDLGARAPSSPRRRPALPAAAPRPRPHDRILHRRLSGMIEADERRSAESDPAPGGLPGLRRALAAPDAAPRPLPLRVLSAPLRARLPVPQLRRTPDDRPDEHAPRT